MSKKPNFNETVHRFENGFTMQWHKGDPALKPGAGSKQIYSLHNVSDACIAILHVERGNQLTQSLGIGETRMTREQAALVIEFVRLKKWKITGSVCMTSLIAQDDDIYYEDDLPENYHYRSDLGLSGCFGMQRLPRGLTVDGTIYLSDCGLPAIPDDLTVAGTLYLNNNYELRHIGRNVRIGGRLSLILTQVETLGDGLTVGGNLDVSDCSVQRLPVNLTLGGDLAIYCPTMTTLPAGLKVGANLILLETPVTALPADAVIGGKILRWDKAARKNLEVHLPRANPL